MIFNDKIPVLPQKCLSIQGIDGYETYKIDESTIGLRPKWIPFKNNDDRLQNHCKYLVTDGVIVTDAYYDVDDFVGYEGEIGEITHWMILPEPPK